MKFSNIINLLVFLLSPFIGLIFAIIGIFNKRRFNLLIVVLLFGLLGYLYVPSITNDYVGYYNYFTWFKNLSLNHLFVFFKARPDFVFYFLEYIFSKAGTSFQFFLMCVTLFNIGVYFYLFDKAIERNKVSNTVYGIAFLGTLFTIYINYTFSVLRFFNAASFILLGWHFLVNSSKKTGAVFLLLAAFTHFGTIPFVLAGFFAFIAKTNYKIIYTVYVISFIGFFIPFSNWISPDFFTGEASLIAEKVSVYSNPENDIIIRGMQESSSAVILHYMRILWVFFSIAYILVTHKRKSAHRSGVLAILGLLNLVYTMPLVFERYAVIGCINFYLLVIAETINSKKLTIPWIVLVSTLLMSFSVNILILRTNIEKSYIRREVLTLPTIFDREVKYKDFIHR